jgi:hypothetical protein
MRSIVRLQTFSKKVAGKSTNQVSKLNDPFFGARLETTPVANVLFRPEEIHGASGIGEIVEPFPERSRSISYYTFRLNTLDDTFFHFHSDWQPTIKAGSINLDGFAWKKPADCQRFEPSLGEPFLLSLNGYAVLGGEVIERRKGSNKIRVGKQPTHKIGSKKLVKSFSAFLGRYP